jgi:hypothetical protein
MTGNFKSSWTPRTGLHKVREKSAEAESSHGTSQEWIYTRGIILRVLGRFPEALTAIREALSEVRRPCPRELYEPA